MKSQFFRRLKVVAGIQDEILYSRRDWLTYTPAVALGVLLCGQGSKSATNSPPGRVIVVGGGFAGAACAYELHAAGYHVRVFEAHQRIGGRVSTSRNWIRGKSVELGAEFIGSNHPYWIAYAKKLGLSLVPVADDDSPAPVHFDGKTLVGEDARNVHDAMDQIHSQLAVASKSISWNQPWASERAVELDQLPFSKYLATLDGPAIGKRGVQVEFTHDLAAAPEKMSTLGVLAIIAAHGHQGYWDNTEAFRCSQGAQRLGEMLLKPLGPNQVILGKPVVKIEYSDQGVKVQLADGVVHEADDLVLTVPPSVWHRIQFSPALPESLQLQMGSAIKYSVKVKTRSWAKQESGIDYLGDDLLGMTWEGISGNNNGAAVAVSFSGGPFADAARAIPAKDRSKKYLRAFESISPGFRSQFVQDEFSDHIADKWIGCGYSCPAPGQVTTVWPALQVGIGRLHFAGEHAGLGFSGFMEGALYSGARVAERIAVRDGIKKSK